MKKIIAIVALVAVVSTGAFAQDNKAGQRSGVVSGFVGCCFGIRAAADYNEGKNLHLMEWGRLIPVFGLYVAVMNFIEGMNGVTRDDLRKNYGAEFF